VALLELVMSRDVYAAGSRVSGVVVLRPRKPLRIRSLDVTVTGVEFPAAAKARRSAPFFVRSLLLSGAVAPVSTAERARIAWNAFLGRDQGRRICAGEHIYPFSIPIPASLPPSYCGKAGAINYTVTARMSYPLAGSTTASQEIVVVFVPRQARVRPVAMSYPSANGEVSSSGVSLNLELPDRVIKTGSALHGTFTLANPDRAVVRQVTVSLEVCEWVRAESSKEIHRAVVQSHTFVPEDPTSPEFACDYSLHVPGDAIPTVEGTAISVIWLLKVRIETEPALEFKTPITVYSDTGLA